jgi:hypothetical protein
VAVDVAVVAGLVAHLLAITTCGLADVLTELTSTGAFEPILTLAKGRAPIVVVFITIVARLAKVSEAVTTPRHSADACSAVTMMVLVADVARLDLAGRGATIAISRIPVVACLKVGHHKSVTALM